MLDGSRSRSLQPAVESTVGSSVGSRLRAEVAVWTPSHDHSRTGSPDPARRGRQPAPLRDRGVPVRRPRRGDPHHAADDPGPRRRGDPPGPQPRRRRDRPGGRAGGRRRDRDQLLPGRPHRVLPLHDRPAGGGGQGRRPRFRRRRRHDHAGGDRGTRGLRSRADLPPRRRSEDGPAGDDRRRRRADAGEASARARGAFQRARRLGPGRRHRAVAPALRHRARGGRRVRAAPAAQGVAARRRRRAGGGAHRDRRRGQEQRRRRTAEPLSRVHARIVFGNADRAAGGRPDPPADGRRPARRPHPHEQPAQRARLHAFHGDAAAAPGDQRGARRRHRAAQGVGVLDGPRGDRRHRPERQRDRRPGRSLDLRDDLGLRRGEPAREDRHARLRRRHRAEQVRPPRRPGRAARRAQAVAAQPARLRYGRRGRAGLSDDRQPVPGPGRQLDVLERVPAAAGAARSGRGRLELPRSTWTSASRRRRS